MNEKAFYQATKVLIQAISGVATSSVFISPAMSTDSLGKLRFPVFQIIPGTYSNDPEAQDQEPGFIQVDWSVVVAVRIFNDPYGENTILGTSNQTGLLDWGTSLLSVINELRRSSGIVIQSTGASAANVQVMEDKSWVQWRQYNFRAYLNT